jgi:hypothetical protein
LLKPAAAVERETTVASNMLQKCRNVVRKHFQSFFQHQVVDNIFVDGIGDVMNKLNASLLCILIALRNPVRGIVIKVQDPTSELQPSVEMQLAGKQFLFRKANLSMVYLKRIYVYVRKQSIE